MMTSQSVPTNDNDTKSMSSVDDLSDCALQSLFVLKHESCQHRLQNHVLLTMVAYHTTHATDITTDFVFTPLYIVESSMMFSFSISKAM